MDRARILRELTQMRTLLSGIALVGVATTGATITACTLRCPNTSYPEFISSGVVRVEGEAEADFRARCVAACAERTGYGSASCVIDEDGEALCQTTVAPTCAAGRLPVGGYSAQGVYTGSAAETYFRRQIALELASVHAFEQLAAALPTWGAGPGFVRAAVRFADDERLHAKILLDAIGGSRPVTATAPVPAVGSAAAMARHNARHGCVDEVFGALLAFHQAEHAPTPALRAAFARIACDEAAHARYAIALDRFLRARVDASDLPSIDEAHLDGLRALRASLEGPLGPDGAGLPSPAVAATMADALFGSVRA